MKDEDNYDIAEYENSDINLMVMIINIKIIIIVLKLILGKPLI